MDVNLGSGYSLDDSVIISKKLKLLNNKGVKTYTSNTSTLDYNNTVWIINGSVNLTNLVPVKL